MDALLNQVMMSKLMTGSIRASLCAMVVAIAFSASSLRADIHTYPVYPSDVIPRDYAYAVQVCQGETKKPLVVYNHCEKSILNGRTGVADPSGLDHVTVRTAVHAHVGR